MFVKRISITTIALSLLIAGCTPQNRPVNKTSLEADGVYVRLLRIEVAHQDVPAFEAVMKRIVQAAESAGLSDEYNWLCYREQPDHYWILSFSDGPSNFACPPGLAEFAETVGKRESDAAQEEIRDGLANVEWRVISEVLMQQNSRWSTVDEMTTRDHPKARIIERTIVEDKEQQHAEAVGDWTNFLETNGYPLPIEGFVVHAGPRNATWQVVFPKDWESFQQNYDFVSFAKTLDKASQAQFGQLQTDLGSTVSDVQLFNGDHAPLLSFGAE